MKAGDAVIVRMYREGAWKEFPGVFVGAYLLMVGHVVVDVPGVFSGPVQARHVRAEGQ